MGWLISYDRLGSISYDGSSLESTLDGVSWPVLVYYNNYNIKEKHIVKGV